MSADALASIQAAQAQLRATQENWHEQCLFDCDDLLTGAIKKVADLQAENARLRAALEAVEYDVYNQCMWCFEPRNRDGHAPDCQRQIALVIATT